jgi:ferritin-like metal-binding protein YciE
MISYDANPIALAPPFQNERVVRQQVPGELAGPEPIISCARWTVIEETEGQIERLEQIFELLGKPARGKKCDAIEGILDEGKEIMEEYKDEPALDAGLLAAAQAVEHYEISRYGTLRSWAAKLSMKDAVKLLDQTLAEEKKTDDALTKLADSEVNVIAQAA